MTGTTRLAGAFLLCLLPAQLSAQEQSLAGLSWTEQKCVLYQRAVDNALDLLGRDGIGAGFLAENAAFIDGGCIGRVHICPRSDREFDLVNLLTIMTMNEGMASTFVPFGCLD